MQVSEPSGLLLGTLLAFCLQTVFSENGFTWHSGRWNLICHLKECCNQKWIPRDATGLNSLLTQNVFGQHLVIPVVYGALRGHKDHTPQKPLVLSFHGTTGTGKNHVANLISQSWYRYGRESKFVHFTSATRHFSDKRKVEQYKQELSNFVYSEVKKCAHQLFIFDEIDSMPPGLLDSLRSFLEYNSNLDGVDFRYSIFIFLSNSGEQGIVRRTMNHYYMGYERESITLKEMEEEIAKWSFSEENGGFEKSRLIRHHLVSHFVPFMPLEREHVKECIVREAKKRAWELSERTMSITELAERVLAELSFRGNDKIDNVYAAKGCKNVLEKVNYVLASLPINGWTDEL